MMKHLPLLLPALCLAVMPVRAQPDAATPAAWLDLWKAGQPPFSFACGGKDSGKFIASWQKTDAPATRSEGGETYHYVYADPATKLKITADVRTFTGFDAIDWVLKFTNEGASDTPILADIEPASVDLTAIRHAPCVNSFYGGTGNRETFAPHRTGLQPALPLKLGSAYGLSSHQTLPFFNVNDLVWNGVGYDQGSDGVIAAIGCTGNWEARFAWNRAAGTVNFRAGMKQTHLVLHPGETIRTPRIILLNWHGSVVDSQNLWRRLVLAFYSPKDGAGHNVTMPVAKISPGYESMDARLAAIKALEDRKIPLDVYELAAGWYGPEASANDWGKFRGTWTPNPKNYPGGLKPLGDALKRAGLGFQLWVEPETADPGTTLRLEHPDWFLPAAGNAPALLNMGNPAARKGITDLVSNLITDSGATWYHHDFSQRPEDAWAAADSPDRIGMTEISYITGLYEFWDDLRARHPGLVIDNSASGANRLDMESISRTVALSASYPLPPVDTQDVTVQLTAWAPLSAGRLEWLPPGAPSGGSTQLYACRGSYGSGWMLGLDLPVDDTLLQAMEEFRQVRPFLQGDFHPLFPSTSTYDPSPLECWFGWQAHRSDLNAGVALLLRREKSDFISVQPALRSIEPTAQYEVEVRTSLKKGPVSRMSGNALANLQVTIPDAPGSALIFYRRP